MALWAQLGDAVESTDNTTNTTVVSVEDGLSFPTFASPVPEVARCR